MDSTRYSFTAIIEHREESYVAYCPQLEEGGHVDGTDFDEVMAWAQSAWRRIGLYAAAE